VHEKKSHTRITTMTFQDYDTTDNNTIDTRDWKELKFTCRECGSHKLVKCLGGQVVYALVDEIIYKPEEYLDEKAYEEDESEEDNEDLEEEVADACVSVQTRPDGSELWDYGVDEANDSYSWFRCHQCGHVLRFEDGSPVETAEELVAWLKARSAIAEG
jgi:hypothetical protein